MSTPRHLIIAAGLLRAEEMLAVQAYPDPGSPLGRALTRRHGPSACMQVGAGVLVIDADLLQLSGAPWTCGYGQTGPDIRHGTVWSRQHAEARLAESVAQADADVCRIWPGADRLHDKARAALVSLVYNRGPSLVDSQKQPVLQTRREMRALGPAILAADYARIATLIEDMRRLWEGKGLDGLLRRRSNEAALVRQAGYEAGRTGRDA